MSGIVTLTLSPCIDKTTTAPALLPGTKLRCSTPDFEPGGTGLNVARALKQLGTDPLAIYPAGGYAGQFLQELLVSESIRTSAVPSRSQTRENLIVQDCFTQQTYRFDMPASTLLPDEWQACLDRLNMQADVKYIVAAGDLPEGVPDDFYAKVANIANHKGARLILEATGNALRLALDEGVYLLKTSLHELARYTGTEDLPQQQTYELAREIILQRKASAIVAEPGAEGAMLVRENEFFHAVAPSVEAKSTLGAGACLLAGIVSALSNGTSINQAVQYGIACGSASTLCTSTKLCRMEDVEKLAPDVKRDMLISVTSL
ncbi:MAG: 1-phosphofructokinase family hexose kinase [Williamsia sp.]|nr:1-phosphofructokinase family hexose kinase [Williamsia sp.]